MAMECPRVGTHNLFRTSLTRLFCILVLVSSLLAACTSSKSTIPAEVLTKPPTDLTNVDSMRLLMFNLYKVAVKQGSFHSLSDQRTNIYAKGDISLQFIKWVNETDSVLARQVVVYYPLKNVKVASKEVRYVRLHYDFDKPYCDTKLGGARNPMAFVQYIDRQQVNIEREVAYDVVSQEACRCDIWQRDFSTADADIISPMIGLIQEKINVMLNTFLVD